jgi:tRNA-specific 2-thiouridylase
MRPGALDSGAIVDMSGNTLGEHNGIINFTVGQRRGLGVATGEPLYVVKIDPDTKHVIVGPKEALQVPEIEVVDLNWLDSTDVTDAARAVTVKVRSTTAPVDAQIFIQDAKTVVKFDQPQEGVAPGQACVVYDGDRVLGGGWIKK